MKTDTIQDYILESEHNLRVAAAAATAWLETREDLVSTFLDRLDTRLKKKLKGWQSERWGGSFFVKPYPGFYIYKPSWENRTIGLQCGEYGKKMVIGIARATDNIRKLPFHPPLLSVVQRIFPSATFHTWWEARVNLNLPAPDWRESHELWRMHADPKFLEEVAEQLVLIAKAGELIIDRLEKNK